MNKLTLTVIAVAVIAGGSSFYGGMKYAEGKIPQGFRGGVASDQFGANVGTGFRGGAGRGPGGTRNGGGFVGGEIIANDGKSITLKLQDGGSQIVFLSSNTKITKSADGSLADLTQGAQIFVNGPKNPDGSVTAQMIQLRPTTQTQIQ